MRGLTVIKPDDRTFRVKIKDKRGYRYGYLVRAETPEKALSLGLGLFSLNGGSQSGVETEVVEATRKVRKFKRRGSA